MSTAVSISSYPELAGFVRLQHDEARDQWVLQAPERILVLDESSREIVDRCDGKATVDDIVEALVAEYDAPRDIIMHDVKAVLGLLAEKTLLILRESPVDA